MHNGKHVVRNRLMVAATCVKIWDSSRAQSHLAAGQRHWAQKACLKNSCLLYKLLRSCLPSSEQLGLHCLWREENRSWESGAGQKHKSVSLGSFLGEDKHRFVCGEERVGGPISSFPVILMNEGVVFGSFCFDT